MFDKSLSAGFAALALGLGLAIGAPVTSANAGSLDIRISDPVVGIHFRGGDRRFHHRQHRRYATCRPGRAVHKAKRFGMRHVRVARVNHRFVVVKGRKHGNKIKVGFYRDAPRCEVAWVKRNHRHHGFRY